MVSADSSAKKLLWDLKSSGTFLPGDSESDPRVLPDWFDKEKLMHAKEVCPVSRE